MLGELVTHAGATIHTTNGLHLSVHPRLHQPSVDQMPEVNGAALNGTSSANGSGSSNGSSHQQQQQQTPEPAAV